LVYLEKRGDLPPFEETEESVLAHHPS